MEYRKALVASFPECRRFSPWPRYKPRAACAPSAARKMRGTPRQSLGRNARDRRLFCSVPQKCTGRTYLHFLFKSQEVMAIGKTRNQFDESNAQSEGSMGCSHWNVREEYHMPRLSGQLLAQ